MLAPLGNRRAAERAAFEPHIDFNGRIAARIQNLARDNCFDAGLRHIIIELLPNQRAYHASLFSIPQFVFSRGEIPAGNLSEGTYAAR